MVLRETEQRQLLPQIAWLERRGATFGGCLRVRETAEQTFLYLRFFAQAACMHARYSVLTFLHLIKLTWLRLALCLPDTLEALKDVGMRDAGQVRRS